MNRYDKYSFSTYAEPWKLPFNELNAALAGKQAAFDTNVANISKLDEMMPKPGYVTEGIVYPQFKKDYETQIEELRTKLNQTGEINPVQITQLAQSMRKDPRYDYISEDYKLKPKIDEYLAKGTYNEDFQQFYNNNQFVPVKDVNTPLGAVYKQVPAADWQEGFRKDVIENIIPQIFDIGPERSVTSVYNPEKGEQEWYVKEKNGKTEVFTEKMVREKLAANPTGDVDQTLADKLYSNLGSNDYGLFYKSKFSPTKEQYVEDLISSTRGRFYEKKDVQEKLTSMPSINGSGSGKGKTPTGPLQPGDIFIQDYGKPFLKDERFEGGVNSTNLGDAIKEDSTKYQTLVGLTKTEFNKIVPQIVGRPVEGLVSFDAGSINPETGVGSMPKFYLNQDVFATLTPEEQRKVSSSRFLETMSQKTSEAQESYGRLMAYQNLQSELIPILSGLDPKVFKEVQDIYNTTYKKEMEPKHGESKTPFQTPEIVEAKKKNAKKLATEALNNKLSKLDPKYKEAYEQAQSLLETQISTNRGFSLSAWSEKESDKGYALKIGSDILSQITFGGDDDMIVNMNDPAKPNGKIEEEDYEKVKQYVASMTGKDDLILMNTKVFYDAQDKEWKGLVSIPKTFKVGDETVKIGKGDPLQVQVKLSASSVTRLQDLGISNALFEKKSQELKSSMDEGSGILGRVSIGNETIPVKKVIVDGSQGRPGELRIVYKGQPLNFNSEMDVIKFTSDLEAATKLVPESIAQGVDPNQAIGSYFKDANGQPLVSTATTNEGRIQDMVGHILDINNIDPIRKEQILSKFTNASTGVPLSSIKGTFNVAPGVTDARINPSVVPIVNNIVSSFPGITITSATRNKHTNKSAGGKQNSKHLEGKAIDVRKDSVGQDLFNKYSTFTKDELNKLGIDSIINESDHFHIEFL